MTKVSVVMPVFNSALFLKDAINSVIGQTFENWELIIVDDFSTDNSVSIVQDLSKNNSRIKIIQLSKNVGAALARNIGIDVASGDFIAFLDSDDIWLPEKLEVQLKQLKNSGSGISFSSCYLIDNFGKIKGVRLSPSAVNYGELLKLNTITNSSGMYDVRKFGKVYQKNVRHEDYVFWLSLLKLIKTDITGIKAPLIKYRQHSGSLSANKFKSLFWRFKVYKDHENISLLKAYFYTLRYIYYAIKRYFDSLVVFF